MKKWLSLMAAMALGLSFVGCDFSDDEDEDVYEEKDQTGEPDPDVTESDFTRTGTCTAGESAGYFWVMIDDDPDGTAFDPEDKNCKAGNPGADIDAICLWRGDDKLACAATVEYAPLGDLVCEKNDKDDPNEVLGDPDGVAADGVFTGYFSLNGGSIVVNFDNDEEILCGDTLHVVEMFNPDNPDSTIEEYKVSIGVAAEGPWNIESSWVTGEALIDVAWEW